MGFKFNRPDRCNSKDSYYWAKPLLDEYFNNNNAYFWEIPIQNLLDITPFHLQRNLDLTVNQETKTNRINERRRIMG